MLIAILTEYRRDRQTDGRMDRHTVTVKRRVIETPSTGFGQG